MSPALNFTSDLLPGGNALKAQLVAALGNPQDGSDPLQNICDAAATDVLRLTTGYVLDPTSLTNFVRAIALYRAYGGVGPVQPDMKTIYDDAWSELTAISEGKRPNLPKVVAPTQSLSAGGFGAEHRIHGRIFPGRY
jgi:hypothetical protein